MKLTKQTVYIGLFSILYLIVAFSSFWHACAFFGLANNSWMSVILAFAFEIGQAAVLFSLLTSVKDRSRVMPWVLMTMFTLVQVIGNVYSSYKYIVTNSVDNLRYFKEPIFIWTSLPDDQATVIVVYLVGALLPIAALLLTSMITNYLSDEEELKKEQEQHKEIESKLENDSQKENQSSDVGGDSQKYEETENDEQTTSETGENDVEDNDEREQVDNTDDDDEEFITDEQELGESTDDEPKIEDIHEITDEQVDEQELKEIPEEKQKSHFINL